MKRRRSTRRPRKAPAGCYDLAMAESNARPTSSAPKPPAASAEASTKSAEAVGAYIAGLQSRRARWQPDVSITALIEKTRDQAQKKRRALGEMIELWEALVPDKVASHTVLTTYKGGVLYVTAESASVRYELDRLLREGLLAALRQQFHRTLARVKITVGDPG